MAESLYQHAKARIITDPLEAHVKKSFGAGCCNCSQSVITPQSGFKQLFKNQEWLMKLKQNSLKMPQKKEQATAWTSNQTALDAGSCSSERVVKSAYAFWGRGAEAGWLKKFWPAPSRMSNSIDTDHIVVNWVSELLQTAAVSSPVILLSEHVHTVCACTIRLQWCWHIQTRGVCSSW